MDQAKWYRIRFNFLGPNSRKQRLKLQFQRKVFIYQLKDDLHFKKIVTRYHKPYECEIFCGKKKLKRLIIEAHLLGLEDELLIFERK